MTEIARFPTERVLTAFQNGCFGNLLTVSLEGWSFPVVIAMIYFHLYTPVTTQDAVLHPSARL